MHRFPTQALQAYSGLTRKSLVVVLGRVVVVVLVVVVVGVVIDGVVLIVVGVVVLLVGGVGAVVVLVVGVVDPTDEAYTSGTVELLYDVVVAIG